MSTSLSGGDEASRYTRVGTDSRSARAGDLFFCLKGENFDGHDFIAAAAAAGVAAVVCEKGRAVAGLPVAFLEVADTLRALGDLAAAHRRRFTPAIVAVTGSNGKTTTKEMLRAILAEHFGADHVLATQGNLNNLIGVPLTLFRLGAEHRAAVIEMGMSIPGEIARLVEITAPAVGLITCVASAHLEGLGSIEGVARAKGELFAGLPDGAVAVVNADDPQVVAQAPRFAGRRVYFGIGDGDVAADVTASAIRCGIIDASSFEIHAGGLGAAVTLPVGGRHNVHNALAAVAASLAIGVPLATAAAGLGKLVPPPMRLSAERLANGVTILNDVYNANPGSMLAALTTLGGADAPRRMVVLGEMRELGPTSAVLHAQVGRAVAAIEPALFCASGAFAESFAEGAREAGLAAERVRVCARHEDAAAAVAEAWRAGDAILVKGSRGAAMEHVVEALRARAATA
ncbi:MAG: UDP-N-acetylmuramoyl-tripeptide--D-alanyl-D-alanine ligase [Deltaproteobacteria bacterium]|nr:UDP-N-acetylmuramoyl-tripeptide--D-alanyl-D-alanine ligase [Deltaproteobacteria bacterium]